MHLIILVHVVDRNLKGYLKLTMLNLITWIHDLSFYQNKNEYMIRDFKNEYYIIRDFSFKNIFNEFRE